MYQHQATRTVVSFMNNNMRTTHPWLSGVTQNYRAGADKAGP